MTNRKTENEVQEVINRHDLGEASREDVLFAWKNSQKNIRPLWLSKIDKSSSLSTWENVARALVHNRNNGATVYKVYDRGFDYEIDARVYELKTDNGSIWFRY